MGRVIRICMRRGVLLVCFFVWLLVIGYVWWQQRRELAMAETGVVPEAVAHCLSGVDDNEPGQVWIGSIIERRVKPDIVQYVMRDDYGCTFLVRGERWPVYDVAAQAQLQAGRWRWVMDIVDDGYARYVQQQGWGGVWSYPEMVLEDTIDGFSG